MTSFLSHQIFFQAAASTIILALFYLFSKRTDKKEQLGFLYLFSLPAKLFFHYYFFSFLYVATYFLSPQHKAAILFPLLIFLAIEVLIMAKLLK